MIPQILCSIHYVVIFMIIALSHFLFVRKHVFRVRFSEHGSDQAFRVFHVAIIDFTILSNERCVVCFLTLLLLVSWLYFCCDLRLKMSRLYVKSLKYSKVHWKTETIFSPDNTECK